MEMRWHYGFCYVYAYPTPKTQNFDSETSELLSEWWVTTRVLVLARHYSLHKWIRYTKCDSERLCGSDFLSMRQLFKDWKKSCWFLFPSYRLALCRWKYVSYINIHVSTFWSGWKERGSRTSHSSSTSSMAANVSSAVLKEVCISKSGKSEASWDEEPWTIHPPSVKQMTANG